MVGRQAAADLKFTYIGLDDEIVKNAGMPISDIVDRYGWEKFREMESEQAEKAAGLNNALIDAGGGIIERWENIEALAANALIFWLKARVDTIVSRIENETQRPALTPGKTVTEEVCEVLERRLSRYHRAADVEIDTDDLTPLQVAEIVVRRVRPEKH